MHRARAILALACAACCGVAISGWALRADELRTDPPLVAKPCVIATLDGRSITTSEVDEIRAMVQPTPPVARAGRLAVDAALAHYSRVGSLRASEAQDWFRSYRMLHADATRDADGRRPVDLVLERLAAARVAGAYSTGTCTIGTSP